MSIFVLEMRHLNNVIGNIFAGLCKSFHNYPLHTVKLVTTVDCLLIFRAVEVEKAQKPLFCHC